MKRYHLGPKGDPRLCQANKSSCPYGGLELHYPTPEKARAAYEAAMMSATGGAFSKLVELEKLGEGVTVLETVHGSHLYGLARADSDRDNYRILTNSPSLGGGKRPNQVLAGEEDVIEADLTTFLLMCDQGVPQALETMFSQMAPPCHLDSLRNSYFLNTAAFATTYRRTILNFARLGVENERAQELLAPSARELEKKGTKESVRKRKPRRVQRNGLLKYRRHSLRLFENFQEGLKNGRFNPTLTEAEKERVLRGSELEDLKFATLIRGYFHE